MCQLLGMNANTPTDVCFSFTGLATRADEHKDGFGIAFFEDKGLRLFIDDRSAREKIAGRMVLLDNHFAGALPLLFDFLGVGDPQHPAPRLDPEALHPFRLLAQLRLRLGPSSR